MQHRTPSPNTQSKASVKFRAVILVLSKPFLSFTRVFHLKQRRPKTHTPTRHRRTTTVMRGSGIPVVRFMFWKEDTQARTPVPSPETRRSRPARTASIFFKPPHARVSAPSKFDQTKKVWLSTSGHS